MKAGFAQFTPVPGDVDGNINQMIQIAENAGGGLLVFPELSTTGYFLSRESFATLAEAVPEGETVRRMLRVSADRNMAIVWGMAEKDGDILYNSAVVVDRGRYAGIYRKSHLFASEKDIFTPGNSGLNVFDVMGIKIGIMVCFDWAFPQACETLALKGAQIIAHPANLVLDLCFKAMPVRAMENRVFTITANRTGREKDVCFRGVSMICSPEGNILLKGSCEQEMRQADINPRLADDKYITPENNIRDDRRPELYYDSERSCHE